MVTEEKVKSLKSQTAVELDSTGVTLVKADPPAVYPAPEASFVAEYAVVDAFSVAAEVYKANLKVSPVEAVKLWVATRISCLNELQIKLPVKAMINS
jgi:hypothetical protein